jgi:hypothetical protein
MASLYYYNILLYYYYIISLYYYYIIDTMLAMTNYREEMLVDIVSLNRMVVLLSSSKSSASRS